MLLERDDAGIGLRLRRARVVDGEGGKIVSVKVLIDFKNYCGSLASHNGGKDVKPDESASACGIQSY